MIIADGKLIFEKREWTWSDLAKQSAVVNAE